MEVFWRSRIYPEMESWNGGPPEADQKDINQFNLIVIRARGRTINPTLHHPGTHFSTIPFFHLSNRTTLSLDAEALEGRGSQQIVSEAS
jgi:hypothetical protein